MHSELCRYQTDEQLINTYTKNSDSLILGKLYNRYYHKIYFKCLTFVKNPDDAFDYTHDIILKAFSHIHSFKGESKFSTWLFAITHNYCISHSVKHLTIVYGNIPVLDQMKDDSPDEQDLKEREKRENLEFELEDYLNKIPENDKQLLLLKYRKNYSIKKIQDEFGLSGSAVKMRLLRARQKIEGIHAVSFAG
jgi:RNA polymerase sigma factor (sigma-70 family)